MRDAVPELASLDSWRRRSWIVGLVALALCIGGAYGDRHQFFRSYLTAYVFWLGIPLGSFAIVMIHHLVGGTWGFVIQRPLESAIRTFPLIALLFLPVFFGMPDLYAWARPEVVAHDQILQAKGVYLNFAFFALRACVYFGVWILGGYFLTKWSHEQDRTGDASLTSRLQKLSGPGLVLYGLTVTFSSIDWVMSIEPRWFSTIYGMIFMVNYGLMALAFVTGVAFFLSDQRPLSRVISPALFHDLGNLLLAFVMLWAYLSFSQFLIVWAENLLDEIPWYLHRTTGGWQGVAVALIVFQFALPFLLLLSREVKRSAGILSGVALGIILMHWIELFWFVSPTFHPVGLALHWMDGLAAIGIGGIWLSAFLWYLKDRSLLPLHDPRFGGALNAVEES